MYFMGESLIFGGGCGSHNIPSYELKTEIYETNKLWTVPKAKDQMFTVRIFGGGGGGLSEVIVNSDSDKVILRGGAGGGGGFMNNADITLQQGDKINITIGVGGQGATQILYDAEHSGVGPYPGINAGNGGTTSFGTYLSALGGQGSRCIHGDPGTYTFGGIGGSGGGGTSGGMGIQFGGGGGGNQPADGGEFGGGGGTLYNYTISAYGKGGCLHANSQNMYEITGYSGLGGNGSSNNASSKAEDGTDTTTNSEIQEEFRGLGVCNKSVTRACGGGGYGGCGGYNGGGGGGYGGNGGNNYGGGGGYGGNGGDNCGGGGGYGKLGSGGSEGLDGYYGGGGSGIGVSSVAYSGNGGDGICIITYYEE